ncbi:hypothetical protein Lal_00029986 [Lupinus albus]|nr:hypothetical protein Lal_00029986 [Lupinus albus]
MSHCALVWASKRLRKYMLCYTTSSCLFENVEIREIIFIYVIRKRIITYNDSNLNGGEMRKLCDTVKTKHHKSTPWRPKMNDTVEELNKNIKKIVTKMVKNYKD